MTVASFETTGQTGQLMIHSRTTMALIAGFGYEFLTSALLSGIGIVFTAILIQKGQHRQAGVKGERQFKSKEA